MLDRNLLAKIHIAKAQLGMDDDSYRAMLRSVADVESAKDLSVEGANRVLRHMERCGFKPKKPQGRHGRPRVPTSREAMLRKIEALLVDAGRTWDYVGGMVKRICKVDAIEFCTDEMLRKLIAALQIDANRRARKV